MVMTLTMSVAGLFYYYKATTFAVVTEALKKVFET